MKDVFVVPVLGCPCHCSSQTPSQEWREQADVWQIRKGPFFQTLKLQVLEWVLDIPVTAILKIKKLHQSPTANSRPLSWGKLLEEKHNLTKAASHFWAQCVSEQLLWNSQRAVNALAFVHPLTCAAICWASGFPGCLLAILGTLRATAFPLSATINLSVTAMTEQVAKCSESLCWKALGKHTVETAYT